VNQLDDPQLDSHDIGSFLRHLLSRIDWRRDAHFQTRTTIDTLDYSGSSLNEGSKVVWAAAGPPRRQLPGELPGNFRLPTGFDEPSVCLPGVLAIRGPAYAGEHGPEAMRRFCEAFTPENSINQFPLVVVVDDSEFVARTLNNFLWVVFTRSDPAADTYGIGAFVEQKHWGCNGALVLDARVKPGHAPPLIEDPEVSRKIDALAARGGPLSEFL
jgi:4-hydroxy-3-polyprenylbenzoate decarboxylase